MRTKNLKKLTILHSNDLHGDFLSQNQDAGAIGGISMLSGYVHQVRNEEKNVLYTISGDMIQGSLIDSEFRGISTIEIMNALTPDIACVGNHEVDYGVAHLLFLERCARFPIINANVYIKMNHVRLFEGHKIIEMDGMKVLFIGIITQEVLAQTKQEEYIGAFVDVEEACEEVGKICDSYQTEDIDFTVLLTHIGIDADRRLAELLNPNWGVDLIIGGHSHTLMEQPEIVRGIPIAQAGSGTGQIGRFDIWVDTDRNAIDHFSWELVPVDEKYCRKDLAMEELIQKYKSKTDEKYSRYITRLKRSYTHPARNQETELGRLFADILAESLGLDLMLVSSGSLRKKTMGPIVDYKTLVEMYPFVGEVIRAYVTGGQLKRILRHLCREEAWVDDAHVEYYQLSRDLRVEASRSKHTTEGFLYRGEEIPDDRVFRVGFQIWHFKNLEEFFGLTEEEVEKNGASKIIATNDQAVLEEYLSHKELVEASEEPRWIMVE